MESTATANEEAIEAWSGVLFDRFLEYGELILASTSPLGEAALSWAPPRPGDSALDIGCGFGDTSLRLAGLVAPEGEVLGVDAAPRFVEAARADAASAGVENVRFEVGDMQALELDSRFDPGRPASRSAQPPAGCSARAAPLRRRAR